MESSDECYQGKAGAEGETEQAPESMEHQPKSTSEFLKLSSASKLISTINYKEQFTSNEDYDTIILTNNDTNADFVKVEEMCQGSIEKKCQYREKHRFSSVDSDIFDPDKSPNLSPTDIPQEDVRSDSKNSWDSVMAIANDDWSPAESDADSGLGEPVEIQFENPSNRATCSPLNTHENDFYGDKNSYKENIIPNISHNFHIASMRLLNNALSSPEKEPDEKWTRKSVIQRCGKTWDLTSLSCENKRSRGSKAIRDTYLPDDEFMEADRYFGDKGKQPASKRYAYKKKSKSVVNHPTTDSEQNTNNLTACAINDQPSTDSEQNTNNLTACGINDQPSTSTAVSTISPKEATPFSEDRCRAISSETPPPSPEKSTAMQGGLEDAGIQWSFYDYAFKLFSSDVSILPTGDSSNNNDQYLYKNENYFGTQNSDDDANLQKGLLMSLQCLKYDDNDDSDMDVTT